MRVDNPNGLQIRIDDGCTDKPHASRTEVVRDSIGERRTDFVAFVKRLPFCKAPNVMVERTELRLNRQESLGIAHSGSNLQPISHNRPIRPQHLLLFSRKICYRMVVEISESTTKGGPFVQYALPRKPGLKALEQKHLEQFPVVVNGNAPFCVMIGDI